MRYTAPRGTRDIKDREAQAFRELERTAEDVFRRYGYGEIRTPVFETAELFSRAVGDTTDIVEKEMYVFQDRGGRSLALRPEGTAGVVRAYLEHGWDKTGELKKLFYKGPMFRAERPQAGRYREFWQIGAEFFGNPSPQADVDVLLVVRDLLAEYGVTDVRYVLNSIGCSICRPAYREALVTYLRAREATLCEDCRRRLDRNPLRCLDCKVDGPSLGDAPKMADHLDEPCRLHNDALEKLLAHLNFPFERDPRLVRGLDYYSRTVFEVKSKALGAQDTLAAGGRYDALVKLLGGPDVPAIGFALGMDRVARARYGEALSGLAEDKTPRVFVALAGEGTGEVGYTILQDLRKSGFSAEIGAPGKSLKAQMRWADGWGAKKVVIVGEEELKRSSVVFKDLVTHHQEQWPLMSVVRNLKSQNGMR